MSDIVERLRIASVNESQERWSLRLHCKNAADEIERLQFELKASRYEIELADGVIERLKTLALPPAKHQP